MSWRYCHTNFSYYLVLMLIQAFHHFFFPTLQFPLHVLFYFYSTRFNFICKIKTICRLCPKAKLQWLCLISIKLNNNNKYIVFIYILVFKMCSIIFVGTYFSSLFEIGRKFFLILFYFKLFYFI